MFKNLIIASLRNLKRNKGYTLLNTLGLTLAITISLLATIKVESELSFEKDYRDYQRLYRINQDLFVSDQHIEAAVTPGAMGPALVELFPEVENSVRFYRWGGTIRYGEKDFDIESVVVSDTSFFELFGIEMVAIERVHPLNSKEDLAISETTAFKVFGKENPLGKRVLLNGNNHVVTAVFSDLPKYSHLNANAIINIEKYSNSSLISSWYDSGLFTYLKLSEKADAKLLEIKLNDFMFEKTAELREKANWRSNFSLMPIANIRLHSHRIGDSGGGSIGQIIALIAVTIIIVILAAVNYTNISVAIAERRAHEVGMRKISGSPKYIIVTQFLCESIILSLVAFLVALPLTEISLASFGELTGMTLSYGVLKNFDITIGFLLFSIVLGIISGFYPAFVLSSFSPLKVIRKGSSGHGRKALFRNVLIVSQFAAGLTLIIITLFVYQQRQFLMDQNIGFDKDNIAVLSTRNTDKLVSLQSVKDEIKALGGVLSVSIAASNPPQDFSASNFIPEDSPDDATMIIPSMRGDSDFVKTLGVKLVDGNYLDEVSSADSMSIIVNQTLVRRMGWINPIGKRIWKDKESETQPYRVIGVVEDFHFESMHTPIKPLIFILDTKDASNIFVKIDPGKRDETIEALKYKWESLFDGKEIIYSLVSDNYNKLYTSEKGMSKGFVLLTLIAIIIACLGLVGLATYSTNQKTKEIGIRKVMGASTLKVLIILWWGFIKLVCISTLVAWPIAYFFVRDWLNNFAYRIHISPWVFIVAAAAGILLAILSVGTITIKAVRQNPAESLKWE